MSLFSYIRDLFTPKTIFVDQSELSDPSISKHPYWFYQWHYDALVYAEYYSWFGEISSSQLLQYDKSIDRRLSDLGMMWFLSVRVEKWTDNNGKVRKKNWYKINRKGRNAIENFKTKFNKKWNEIK